MTRFQKLAIAAAATTFALIAVGALVRATGSGLGCPGWPTCHGRIVPPLRYHALIEYSHRLLATIDVVLVALLLVSAWRNYRRVGQIFRPVAVAAVLVVVQAALGGIVVKGDLRAALVTAHFATAMLLAGILTHVVASAFCFVKLPLKGPGIRGSDPRFARLTVLTTAATLALLIVGAYVRGQNAGLAFTDWPLMNGKLVPQLGGVATTQFLHRVLAAAVGVLVLLVAIRAWTMTRRSLDLVVLASLAFGLFLAQILVGAALVWTRLSAGAKVAHVVLASLIWGSLVALATVSRRLSGRPAAVGAEAGTGAGVRPSTTERVRTYLQLTKPRIVVLLLVTTVPTMVLAAGGWPSLWLVFATLLGGTLAAGGANAMNQFFDRDIDELMRRTRRRPLPAGRVAPERALTFGYLLGVAAFLWLGMTVNVLAAGLAMSALLFYVLIYTLLLKRTTDQNIVIGGAAGAVPVLVGWAAVTGHVSLSAWVLFAIVFAWTPPHFWALSMRYASDYAAAGVPMLPVVRGERETARMILRYSVLLLAITLLLFPVARMGAIYLAAAIGLGGAFVWRAAQLRRRFTPALALGLFKFSITYLGLLFAAIAVDALLPLRF